MTDDIVERLRTAYLTGPDRDVLTEAAAEIERLSAAVDAKIVEAGEMRLEVERLRAALQLSQSQNYCMLCGRALEPKP